MSSRKTNVLSIDGGGVRGLMSAMWLDAVRLLAKRPLHEVYDVIAGSSTGAVLACLIASGRDISLKTAYIENLPRIFEVSRFRRFVNYIKRIPRQGLSAPKHDHKNIQHVLKGFFGDMRMRDLKTRVIITGYDTISGSAVVFKSHNSEHEDMLVWQVVAGSCAAPTYFPAQRIDVTSMERTMSIIDGGLVANNPVLCAVADCMSDGIDVNDMCVLSLGTQGGQQKISHKDAREWGLLQWAFKGSSSPIINVALDGPMDAWAYIAKKVLGNSILRISATCAVDMDDASVSTLTQLKDVAVHRFAVKQFAARAHVDKALKNITDRQ